MNRLYQYLDRAHDVHPQVIAIEDGAVSLNYGELWETSKRVAHKVRDAGVGPGQVVALDLPPQLTLVFTMALLHEATISFVYPQGVTSLPFSVDWLFTMDPNRSSVATHTVLVDSALVKEINGCDTNLHPRDFASDDALCRLVFSSGTTGTPKAIALSVDMALARSEAAEKLWPVQGEFLCTLGISSASGFHSFIAAVRNAKTFFVPGDASHNLGIITRHGVSSVKASPVQIAELFDEAMKQAISLSGLRSIYSAGSVVPLNVRHMVASQSQSQLTNLFGSSEAGRAAERVIDDDVLDFAGVVVAGTELEIVDEAGQPLGGGHEGIVRYRRAGQAVEYFGDAQTTQQVFIDGWFYSGDLGRLESGNKLFLTGRRADIINAGGVKINPAEAVRISLGCPGVREAVGFEHRPEQGLPAFGLAVVIDSDSQLQQLVAELRSSLGDATPSIIFSLPSMPRNDAGKILAREVAQMYAAAIKGH